MKKKVFFVLLSILVSIPVYAQRKLQGCVIDENNEPLIGVTVLVKGTVNGTVTSLDGDYTLSGVPDNSTLVFSMIGYNTVSKPVGKQTVINVVMQEAMTELKDVVVIGYGSSRKGDLTSSISSVNNQDLQKVASGNAMDALQGKVSGMNVISQGGPGASPRVVIRGVTSTNGSSPLYVVDGMPVGGNANFINSDDIESMVVLKDASASAIYGTRASNGVILITTKRGVSGKVKFNFNAKVGLQNIKGQVMADNEEYKRVFNTRFTNDNSTTSWNDKGAIYNPNGTNWWKEAVNPTALIQNYNISARGGNDNLTYSFSLGYFHNESQFEKGYWDKLNIRINTEYKFSNMVKLGVDLAPIIESWEDTPSPFKSLMVMDPTTPIMKPESEWVDNSFSNYERSYNNAVNNPLATIARSNKNTRKYGLIATPFLSVTPIKNLVLRSQIGVNTYFLRSNEFQPKFNIGGAFEFADVNTISRKMQESVDWNWTNTANYSFNLKKHSLNVMGGFTMEKYSQYDLFGSRDEVPGVSDNLHEVSAGTKNQMSSGMSSVNTLMSYLGRVSYNWNNRYYVTSSLRVDGSSKFPTNNQYAIFPSASVAWRISGENFMENLEFISDMKLRAGWGRVGNQSIPNNAYLTLLGQSDYVFGTVPSRLPGSSITTIGNDNLIWETVEDFNIGIDLSLLNSRLGFSFDAFQKTSHDMLYEQTNILASGFPAPQNQDATVWANVGSMRAKGVEVSVNWREKVQDFTYNIGMNFSAIKNTAIKFSGDGALLTGSFNGDHIIRNEEGGEISRFYGYLTNGLFQNMTEIKSHSDQYGNLMQPFAKPGDIRFVDLNNDGKINESDKTFLGSAFPDFVIGLNMNLEYKNFDFAANFYGTFGNDVFNKNITYYSGVSGQNVFQGTYDASWKGEGTSNYIPRLSRADLNQNFTRVSDFFVEDGSYLRCKLIQLGYTLPKKIARNNTLRVYVSAQNLFTITSYSGVDPEIAAMGSSVMGAGIDDANYPNPRTFLVGVNLNF